jgi:hypothetical protein
VDGPEREAIRRRDIEERYRLMPYLYTAAEHTSRDGVPMMRPLFVDFPDVTADGAQRFGEVLAHDVVWMLHEPNHVLFATGTDLRLAELSPHQTQRGRRQFVLDQPPYCWQTCGLTWPRCSISIQVSLSLPR